MNNPKFSPKYLHYYAVLHKEQTEYYFSICRYRQTIFSYLNTCWHHLNLRLPSNHAPFRSTFPFLSEQRSNIVEPAYESAYMMVTEWSASHKSSIFHQMYLYAWNTVGVYNQWVSLKSATPYCLPPLHHWASLSSTLPLDAGTTSHWSPPRSTNHIIPTYRTYRYFCLVGTYMLSIYRSANSNNFRRYRLLSLSTDHYHYTITPLPFSMLIFDATDYHYPIIHYTPYT